MKLPNNEQQILLQTIAEEYLYVGADYKHIYIAQKGIVEIIKKWEKIKDNES